MNPILPHQRGLLYARRLLQFGENNGSLPRSPSAEMRSRMPNPNEECYVQETNSVPTESNGRDIVQEGHLSDNRDSGLFSSTKQKPRSMLAALLNQDVSNDCDKILKHDCPSGLPAATSPTGKTMISHGVLDRIVSSGTTTVEYSPVETFSESKANTRWMESRGLNKVDQSRAASIVSQPNLSPPSDIPKILIPPYRRRHNVEDSSSVIPGRVVDPSVTTFQRRCLSSKDLCSTAYMLYRKELIETEMKQRLQKAKESSTPPVAMDDSSITERRSSHREAMASRSASARSNEARKYRRAEHHKAITRDLTEIVTDLFIAESKLLNPSMYGVESSPRELPREQIMTSVELFISSLPPRYALGVESPSEVLLHMRLMATVRADPSRPTVHIANLDDETHWISNPAASAVERARRLVTICCSDKNGLLEYISRLLATGGARVLDADVLLSSDNIALDRFVLEMNGRLRLDKLAYYIEQFLAKARNNRIDERHESSSSRSEDDGSAVADSITMPIVASKDELELPTSLYFISETNSKHNHVTDEVFLEEINAAVPLEQALSKGNSRNLLSNLVNDEPFLPMTRNFTMLPPRTLSLTKDSLELPTNHTNVGTLEENPLPLVALRDVAVPKLSPTLESATEGSLDTNPCSGNIRQQRPLVKRPGSSSLGRSQDPQAEQDQFGADDAFSPSALQKRSVPFIPFGELMLIETLGMGRVSTIYRAAWRWRTTYTLPESHDNIRMVALKVAMVNKASGDTSNVDELRREADIAARLHHPCVCDLVGIAADDECFCLAYDFCEGGSLLSLLSDKSRYYEYLPIALDIANGMAYLHAKQVIHRDLKPSNILLTRDHRAKISDFGMSVTMAGQELTAETGTYRYMAPEVIRHESYSSNADVYSFGICLWQLITREVPFATMTPIQAAFRVVEGDRPKIPDGTVPKRLREIIVSCWDSDSYKRPSFTWIAMALADYAKDAFSAANVGTQTLMIANEMLANVEGNATVNVDFSATLAMGAWIHPDGPLSLDDDNSNIGLEI